MYEDVVFTFEIKTNFRVNKICQSRNKFGLTRPPSRKNPNCTQGKSFSRQIVCSFKNDGEEEKKARFDSTSFQSMSMIK